MNELADKLGKRGELLLTAVNVVFVFAIGHLLHTVGLRHGEIPDHVPSSPHALLHMPSVLIVVLMVALLGLLIGKEWLRPRWLPLVLNLVGLIVGPILLFKLSALLE
jgi:hypothetical protein